MTTIIKKISALVILFAFLFTSEATAYGESTINMEQSLSPIAAQEAMTNCMNQMAAAHRMAEAARDLHYSEDHYVIQLAKKEYDDAKEDYLVYHDFYSSWLQKEIEYPVAAYVWKFFKNEGFSDQVIAGILGNMMVECGGLTLNLHWDAYSKPAEFYGLCQWSKTYFPDIHGADIPTQCQYLLDTMESQFSYFGSTYRKGFNYESFLLMDNAYDAGYAFCLGYEVGHGASLRAKQAVVAYEYFTS